MASEDEGNVISRGFGAIRNVFTGRSATDDARLPDDNAPQTLEDSETTAVTETPPDSSQSKASEYADVMQQCAAGDLTTRMEVDGETEQMDRVGSAFTELANDLEQSLSHLKSYVEEVQAAGTGVEQSADSVREASDGVVDSMQIISRDVEDQQEQLGGGSRATRRRCGHTRTGRQGPPGCGYRDADIRA